MDASSIFSMLLLKLTALYIVIFLGFLAGRQLGTPRDAVSKLVLFIIAPVVFFTTVAKARITLDVLSLPLLTFCISSALCFLTYTIAKHRYSDATGNLLAMSAGNGNTGYFGLPVALLMFDVETVGIYLTAMIGISIYESTVGYYITARGQCTAKDAFRKMLRLPVLHAFIGGVIFNKLGFTMPPFLDDFSMNMRGAYVIMGMMIIGLSIARMQRDELDAPFILTCLINRFAVWPLLVAGLIALDNAFFHIYPENIHQVLSLLSIVPMAANTVVIADVLGVHSGKAAVAVLISTLVALFYVPLMVSLLF